MIYENFEEIPRHYRTIVVDPPWSFKNVRTGGSLTSGSAGKYPVMEVKDIIGLFNPPKYGYGSDRLANDIADNPSMLFLWTPCAIKDVALEVMDAWGFTYKTTIYWIKGKWEPFCKGTNECILKGRYGMGFWFSNTVEECLFGIRGKVTSFRSMKRNIICAPPGRHSEKPEEFWELIRPYIRHPAIELFARAERDGFDCYGNELGVKQDVGAD